MTELRIRNIEPWIVEVFRGNAKKRGRSMEQEIRDVLSREAVREKNEFIEMIRQSQERQQNHYGLLPDSTPGIREDRESM